MTPRVVCAGGVVLDRHLHLLAPPVPATSNPARGRTSGGGVARNVAENLALLGARVRLVSRVGDDDAGRRLLGALGARGVDVAGVVVVPGATTAQYVAVLGPDGDLVIGIADMAVLDGVLPADLDRAWPGPAAGEWVFVDCNLPAPVLRSALSRAGAEGTPLAVDAVSTPKVVRLAAAGGSCLAGVAVLFCNLDEARALLGAVGCRAGAGAVTAATALVGLGARAVVLTRGADGVVIADAGGARTVPAAPAEVVDVTGAGDALVAATLAGLAAGGRLDDAVRAGTRAAALTVACADSVRPELAAALEEFAELDPGEPV